MKALLAFLVTFSVFANNDFAMEKETTMKRLQAAKTNVAVVTCVQNAKTMEEMAACENTPAPKTPPTKVEAKAPTAPTTPAPAPTAPAAH
jgi:hypothetical protein